MKSRNRILALAVLVILSSSPLHAADEIVIHMPKNKSVENMIDPPFFPLNTKELTLGFFQGFALPFLGIILLSSPAETYRIRSYTSLRNDPKNTALTLGPWKCTQEEKTKLMNTYVQIRTMLKSNNLTEADRFIDEYNIFIRRFRYYEHYDIRLKHNEKYHDLARQISQRVGVAIGSTLSSFACLYGLYHHIKHMPPQPTCKQICTQICTPPAINDLD